MYCNADLSDIRINIRPERPEELYKVEPASFDEEAYLRHDRQAIFERRRAGSVDFSMTDDDDSASHSPVKLQNLYLPTIAKAVSQRSTGLRMSASGRLALVLCVFFHELQSGVFPLRDRHHNLSLYTNTWRIKKTISSQATGTRFERERALKENTPRS
ncbi:hypothetical protein BU23DRAFT_572970 [Bimuria novae-zelandiae CBS 107.79]|uniref:Uncharacterized protein n=1 Tax=Bimuria novae-zelandiae CBS 107.79 TaxID=1447943 RepID=A0A6A5URZ2_9PLEO|nr:hypothetical protein BU23DRAFT_572970 [Bimuria novae-zelandiae CBS 107.79]